MNAVLQQDYAIVLRLSAILMKVTGSGRRKMLKMQQAKFSDSSAATWQTIIDVLLHLETKCMCNAKLYAINRIISV